MFRKCAAMLWLLAICLPGHARASVGDTAPIRINAPVQYPQSAIEAREQGTVTVKMEVLADGHVANATIDTYSGHPDLDAAALQSVSLWSFSPGTKDGKPEARWVRVPVEFNLTEDTSDAVPLPQDLPSIPALVACFLGGLLWLTGFIWSIVLAKRKSILWLSGMVALWIVAYPLFVVTNWSAAKRSLIVVGLGIALSVLGAHLLPAQDVPH